MKKIKDEFLTGVVAALEAVADPDPDGEAPIVSSREIVIIGAIGVALQDIMEKYSLAKHVHYHPGKEQKLTAIGDQVIIEPVQVAGILRE